MEVVDALVVTLGLDTKGLSKGQKEADAALDKTKRKATKDAKEIEAAGKAAAQYLVNFRNEAIKLATVLVGASGLKNFIDQLTDADAALGRLARNVGTSTEDLSAWQGVAKRFGGSAEDVGAAFKNIVKIIEEVNTAGDSGAILPLQRAGVDVAKFLDKATPATERMMMLADAMKRLSAQAAQFFGGQAGFSEGMINVLREGRVTLEQQVEAQKKRNVVSERDAELAVQRARAWADLTDTFIRMGRVLVNEVSPVVTELAEVFARWLDQHKEDVLREIVNDAKALAQWVKEADWRGFAEGVKGASDSVKSLVAELGGAVRVGEVLLGLWAGGKAVGIASGAARMAGAIGGGGALAAAGGVGAAGAAGYGLGSLLFSRLGDDTQHKIGGTIATILAGMGFKGAQEALDAEFNAAMGSTDGGSSRQKYLSGLERKYGLPSKLMDSAWNQESSRGKNMRSPKGAMGHFQFMPSTAQQYGLKDPDNFYQSADAAARMLRDLMGMYKGDLNQALAAYNYGSGNLAKSGMGNLPAETQRYISSIRAGMSAGTRYGGRSASASSSTSEVHIGQITINSQATDAKGILRDLHGELKQFSLTANAQGGGQ